MKSVDNNDDDATTTTPDDGAWVYYKLTCEPSAQVSEKLNALNSTKMYKLVTDPFNTYANFLKFTEKQMHCVRLRATECMCGLILV